VTAEAVQVTTTVDSVEAAERMARALVEERLAACVQVQGPIASTYRWQGAIERAAEWYCHVKTTRTRVPDVVARIRALHSYQTPEVIVIPVAAEPAYAAWIADAVADPR
jgi:periplasmic divalent cation tolerance protein